jgi:spore coat polysaccharide biosynthesis protein SpsF
VKASVVIAARLGSSRLPGKCLMPILGKPMLERMLERVRASRHVRDVVIATTELAEDDAIAALAGRLGARCFRGSVHDVLGRISAAANSTGADEVVELLGDNPLVHADLIDDVVEFFRGGRFDYAASVTTEHSHAAPALHRFPIGVRVEVITPAVLAECARTAREPRHREHTTSFIYEHPDRFRLGYFEARGRWAELHRPPLTFAVNYEQNLDLVRRIFERCHHGAANFTLADVIRAFDSDPTLQPLMGTPTAAGASGS